VEFFLFVENCRSVRPHVNKSADASKRANSIHLASFQPGFCQLYLGPEVYGRRLQVGLHGSTWSEN
jgi:hypothetical protein